MTCMAMCGNGVRIGLEIFLPMLKKILPGLIQEPSGYAEEEAGTNMDNHVALPTGILVTLQTGCERPVLDLSGKSSKSLRQTRRTTG